MVDRDQRLAGGNRQSLAGEQGDHHPADQPRPGGGGDGIDLADRDIGLGQHLADQPGQDFDMGARGDFGHHPAERAMRLILPDHRLGEDLPVAADQRRGAVVARGFETEDERHACSFASSGRRSARGAAMERVITLGTRGSPLALAQARQVAAALEAAHGWAAGTVVIKPIRTSGDRIQRPAAGRGRRQGAVDQGARPRVA